VESRGDSKRPHLTGRPQGEVRRASSPSQGSGVPDGTCTVSTHGYDKRRAADSGRTEHRVGGEGDVASRETQTRREAAPHKAAAWRVGDVRERYVTLRSAGRGEGGTFRMGEI